MQAHETVSALLPSQDASPAAWREFYRRSAAVYTMIAEVDRGHHHEALYWARREQRKAEELSDRAGAGAGSASAR
nr:AMED_5909 family protein [Amycolatopsis aidingensis]